MARRRAGVAKKKAAPGHSEKSAKKEQAAWVNGTKDFDLDTVSNEAFRIRLETDKQEQPNLTYAQITNAYHTRNAEFSSQARKLLKTNDITPWTSQVGGILKKPKQKSQNKAVIKPAIATTSTTDTQSVEQKPQRAYVLPNIKESATAHLLVQVPAATRAQRPDITLADVLEWARDLCGRQKPRKRRRGLYDYLKANMNSHASDNDSCEDLLLHCITLKAKHSKFARMFLWHIVHSREDMHLADAELKRLKASIESESLRKEQVPDENVEDHADSDDKEDHGEQTRHDHNTDSEMNYEPEPAPLHGRRKEHEEQDSRTASWKSINANAQEPDKVKKTSSTPLETIKKTSTTPSDPIQFWQLTPEEQKKQTRYYGFEHPSDIVRCMTCGKKGHMSYNCVILCEVCGEQRAPGASHPPCRKCLRCRVRGHNAEECTRPTVIAGAVGDECDLCGRGGHAEGECSRLWGVWEDVPEEDKVRAEDMPVPQCYCCCGQHWGDDCPRLPERIRKRVAFCNSWSAANAARWIKDPTPPARTDGQTSGSLPAYQLRLLNDFDLKLH